MAGVVAGGGEVDSPGSFANGAETRFSLVPLGFGLEVPHSLDYARVEWAKTGFRCFFGNAVCKDETGFLHAGKGTLFANASDKAFLFVCKGKPGFLPIKNEAVMFWVAAEVWRVWLPVVGR